MKIMQNYLFGGMKIEIQYLRAILLFYKFKIKSNLEISNSSITVIFFVLKILFINIAFKLLTVIVTFV